jgi:hypothetical protein
VIRIDGRIQHREGIQEETQASLARDCRTRGRKRSDLGDESTGGRELRQNIIAISSNCKTWEEQNHRGVISEVLILETSSKLSVLLTDQTTEIRPFFQNFITRRRQECDRAQLDDCCHGARSSAVTESPTDKD